jgi:hypothetical protein
MATKYNISLDQGSDFRSTFTITDDDGEPLDLTPYTGASEMRKHYSSSNSVSLTVGLASDGVVTLSMPSAQTSNLIPGRYRYDVEITDNSNNTFRILEGIITVTPNMTRG